MKLRLYPIFALLAALTAYGDANTRILTAEPIRIAPRAAEDPKRFDSHAITFDPITQHNTTAILRLECRMQADAVGGSSHMMQVMINGQELLPAKSRLQNRLRNKALTTPVEPDAPIAWYRPDGGWNVLYAPDFNRDALPGFYVGDPFVYEWDITDLVYGVVENRLEIINTTPDLYLASYFNPDSNPYILTIGKAEIDILPQASPMVKPVLEAPSVVNRGEAAAGPAAYRGEVLPGGGFTLTVGDVAIPVHTVFSVPGGGSLELSATTLVCDAYRVERRVDFTPRRVEVRDTITNRSATEPVGIAWRNRAELPGDLPVRLAGSPDAARDRYISYGNPSVFAVLPNGKGLGLIVEDAVSRYQTYLYAAPGENSDSVTAGFGSDMLFIPPGASYTLEWAVYPVDGPDYYDFVNLVRADWGANYTVDGPWRWQSYPLQDMSVEKLRELFTRHGVKYYICEDWAEWTPNARGTQRVALGTEVLDDYWSERHDALKAFTAKLREAVPELKFLLYYNSMRESRDDTRERFPGCLRTDEWGNDFSSVWQTVGDVNANYLMVPTVENTFGRAMLETARCYLDELGYDGIYWDEAEGIWFNQILTTCNEYDGHSALLDPATSAIRREVGIMPLLSRDFINAVTDLTTERGKLMLQNGPTGSADTLARRVPRMTEVQHNDYYAYEGHLQPPLGYMCWNNDGWPDMLRVLKLGIIPAVFINTPEEIDLWAHLFPFTPIEIHAGYLLGEERVIATHSGSYGWHGSRDLGRVWHFNAQGSLSGRDFPTTVTTEAKTEVELGELEAVVIERLPMRFEPHSGAAVISQIVYSQDEAACDIDAPMGGVLTVDGKDFEVPPAFHGRFQAR